jgi:hypothetical protein
MKKHFGKADSDEGRETRERLLYMQVLPHPTVGFDANVIK